MEYKNINNDTVSMLGYGCMRFPTRKDGKIDYEKAEKLIDKAVLEGVTYFDTAYNYHNGESESFIGKALNKYERSSYYLATKLPWWKVNSIADAEKIFNEQLEKLNKEYIDFYLLHALDEKSWQKIVELGIIDFCEGLKASGRIKYFGFSFHDSYEVFEKILTFKSWDFCQIQLNYMDIDEQAGMKGYALAEKLGIPIVIMEPVKGGLLANLPEDVKTEFEKASPGKTPSSWALRWVGSLPGVKVILSGMSNQRQLSNNLKTFKKFKPLTEAEKKAVEAAIELLKKRVKNSCTGCRYCMPCPSGVNIPEIFSIWNTWGMYKNRGQTNWYWQKGIGKDEKADKCIECGKCEKICPQKLSIIKDLKTASIELNDLVIM